VSLRRRIAAAAALAVAAVALTLGVTGYLTARSHLVGELQRELRSRAAPFLEPHTGHGDQPTPRPGGGSSPSGRPAVPSAPPLGGAPGYFQFVHPNGTVVAGSGGTPQLPVDARVLGIAKQAQGSFFFSARVNGTHVEILTVGDPFDHYAVEVALPLTSVDSVLSSLLVTYALLVGAGVLLAGLFGGLIARSALAPIASLSRPSR
jgi:hypothetical protein